jgi:hypothetical protein
MENGEYSTPVSLTRPKHPWNLSAGLFQMKTNANSVMRQLEQSPKRTCGQRCEGMVFSVDACAVFVTLGAGLELASLRHNKDDLIEMRGPA